MRKSKRKKSGAAGNKRRALLVACVSAALLAAAPVQASPKITGETVDKNSMAGGSFTIGPGQDYSTLTTYALKYQNSDTSSTTTSIPLNVTYSGTIVVLSGGIWRPMDAVSGSIGVTSLELESGAILDLSYKYGEALGDSSTYPAGATYWTVNNNGARAYVRNLTVGEAILHNGAIIRLNVGGGKYAINSDTGVRTDTLQSDKVTFYGDKIQLPDGVATVLLQIRYNKNTGGGLNATNALSSTDVWALTTAPVVTGTINNVVNVYNIISTTAADGTVLTTSPASSLAFTADQPYYIDSSLNKYYFVPVLNSTSSTTTTTDAATGVITDNTTKYYSIDWTATRSEFVSQGVFSAANAQLAMRNLWRMEDGLFWKRGETLRAASQLGQHSKAGGADGAWAQVWRGQYDFAGAYGSDFAQSYNGIQVGYDKQREGKFYGGRLYTGLFLSQLNSNADFHRTADGLYSSAGGDLKSGGLGLYTSWLGDKGHYLDVTVRGSKLSNKYKFSDSDGNLFANDYGTWTYGAGLRYGLQKELAGGWYLEPQAGLSYGTMKSYSYIQDNGMRYNQDKMDMLIGRFGVTAGRKFASDGKKGVLYAKAAVNHDFKDGGSASADAGAWDSSGTYHAVTSLPVNTLNGKDTWYEFAVGANLETGRDQNAFVELTKTAGGKVNTDWQVNAGMAWRFNGPEKARGAPPAGSLTDWEQALAAKTVIGRKTTDAAAPAADTGAAAAERNLAAGRPETAAAVTAAAAAINSSAQPSVQAGQAAAAAGTAPAAEPDTAGDSPAATATDQSPVQPATEPAGSPAVARDVPADSEPGSYALAPLVVEAKRPEWEKKLSPGTVSVIHVPDYKGEMKNLPDLLQTVPGVYVQRLQGTGHYTVARVRGSTGGQVNIYIDGVLVNSNADVAVDLATIPVENVERIEVYRGYVPARFAGAPIGGAINIVTKKPQDASGSITQGVRSFGGYTGNLELTAPAGSGSLLFALNRDQARGDFRYKNLHALQAYDPATQDRHRLYNDYQNTDALLKWQDDNWFAKLTWKENKTSFPESTYTQYADVPLQELIDEGLPFGGIYNKYRQRQLNTTTTEFQFGRRQTDGNLEWGWKLDTSYQLKRAASSQTKSANGAWFLTADNDFRNRRYEGTIDGSWQAGDNHLVEFLLKGSRETMDVDTHNLDRWPPKVSSVGNDGDFYKKYFKEHYQTNNYHLQVQDTMTLNKSGSLFFTPILRAQKMDMDVDLGDPDLGSWKYSYGLGLKKVQNEHWTFRGTYGTYYKFPNWYELFGDGVNVKSRWEMYRNIAGQPQYLLNSFVERGTSWDVSANWQGKALAADTDVTLTYFNRRAKNLSSYSIDFYGWGYYTNLAAGNIQGLELESKMRWKRWDLLLAATWNDSVITASGSKASLVTGPSWRAGSTFPWIPEWEYNVRLGYRFPGDRLSAFTEYHYLGKVAQFGIGDENSTTYDALGITNVGLKYDLSSRIKLTAGVNDLFNKGPNQLWHSWGYRSGSTGSYIVTGSGNVQYPQQGRTYYMTAQYFF
ncbi:TonB-dependent receptor domain-containing protein [Sporomusa aerivorans]|uniref:TonB-dependent receptor domain-containing protein n=1 Tax=Sporomusa aerivorans TaxID=204936 RepID=UPI00352BD03C